MVHLECIAREVRRNRGVRQATTGDEESDVVRRWVVPWWPEQSVEGEDMEITAERAEVGEKEETESAERITGTARV